MNHYFVHASKLFLAAISASYVLFSGDSVHAEELKTVPDISPGAVTVKDDASPSGYTVYFAFDPAMDHSGKKIKTVAVKGVFNYLNPDQPVQNDANGYSPYAYKNGYYASNVRPGTAKTQFAMQAGYQEEMKYDEESGLYTASFPITSGSFGYQYVITYDEKDEEGNDVIETIEDPANPADRYGKMNAYDKRKSGDVNTSIVYGHWDPVMQSDSPNLDAVLPSANYGKLEYVNYVAADDKENSIGVYVPSDYDPERKEPYRTIYLSHGGGGDETDWFHMGSADYILENTIAAGETQSAILVTMDNMYFGFDPAGKGEYQGFNLKMVEENILECIIPTIESKYNVSRKADDRAYIGLSFGGRSACDMFWDHPDQFGYFGMLSCASWETDESGQPVHAMIDAYRKPVLYCGVGTADFANGDLVLDGIFPSMVMQPFANWAKNNIPEHFKTSRYGLVFPGSHDWFQWPEEFHDFLRDVAWKNNVEIQQGVSVSSNTLFTETTPDAGYQATFTLDTSSMNETPVAVAVAGNMQFYSEDQIDQYVNQQVDDDPMNGDEMTIPGKTAFAYQKGMFTTGYSLDTSSGRTTNGGLEYPMSEVDTGVYQVTLPLPAGMYYYDYIITTKNEKGEEVKKAIPDPANLPLANSLNGNNCGHSVFWAGTSNESLPNDQYSFPRMDGRAGTVQFVSYASKDSTMQPLGIYLPYQYDSTKEYPVLYLSHGGGGNEADWLSIGAAQNIFDNLIADGYLEPTIIVTMNNSYYRFFNGDSVSNLVGNIIPFVEQNYSVKKERSGRAFAGLSAGGGTAIDAMLKENDVFDYYGIWSPSVMPMDQNTITGNVAVDVRDASFYYISVGNMDLYVRRNNDKMVFDSLAGAGSSAAFDYQNGAHDWSVWRAQLSKFAKQYLWKPVQYHMTEGANAEYTRGSGSLKLVADGALEKFSGLQIDGKLIDQQYYDAKSGSTVLTIHGDFLEQLDNGIHQVSAVYKDGHAETTIRIAENGHLPEYHNSNITETKQAARTGVESWTGIFSGILIISISLSGIAIYIKKKFG